MPDSLSNVLLNFPLKCMLRNLSGCECSVKCLRENMLVITVWSVGPWNLSFAVGSANHNPVQFLVYALPSILGVWFRTHQLLAVNPCKIKILELLVYNFWFLVMISFISYSSVVGMLIYTWFDLNSDWGSQFIPCGSVSVLSVLGSLQWVVCSLLVTPI